MSHSAVADAPDQLVNQRVLQLAKTVDPAGCRTIGVITKVDLIELGTEQRVQNPLKVTRGSLIVIDS